MLQRRTSTFIVRAMKKFPASRAAHSAFVSCDTSTRVTRILHDARRAMMKMMLNIMQRDRASPRDHAEIFASTSRMYARLSRAIFSQPGL